MVCVGVSVCSPLDEGGWSLSHVFARKAGRLRAHHPQQVPSHSSERMACFPLQCPERGRITPSQVTPALKSASSKSLDVWRPSFLQLHSAKPSSAVGAGESDTTDARLSIRHLTLCAVPRGGRKRYTVLLEV